MSSLFAALGVSVSGLDAQSAAIGNISDDLSNAQTTGFKSIGTEFEDLVTASSATDNSPGGVRASPLYQNDVQGTIDSTSTTTNLAISGSGFFPVVAAVQTTSGSTEFTNNYYTRQGDFTLNQAGYMVNSSGYYLLGYPIASNGTVDASATSEIQISSLLDNPVSTSTVTYAANLPAGATGGAYTSTASTIQIYDAEGNTHQMSLTWIDNGNNEWSAKIDVSDGVSASSDYTATVPVTFNSATNIGTIQTISGGTGYTVDPTTIDAGVSFNLTFPNAGTQTVDLNLGAYNTASGTTQFANSTSTVSVSSFQQNGLGAGSFSSIGIDNSGIVSINYSNGSTRQIYQIPITQFNSPDNLQRVTGGAYQATLASGSPNTFPAGTNGAGTISSSSLEASNVDIATEFTNMIEAQQIYSANAKTVTTVDSMLNTIIQAIQ
jgi:flagellar hook protein FlgE